jgi:hypothetical protein
MANEVLGAGAILSYFSGGIYNSVANVKSIGGLDISYSDVDTTNLANVNRWKTSLAAWADAGVIPCECNFAATMFNTLLNLGGQTNTWRITFSNGSKWDFTGYINALKTEIPLEDIITMPFAIKVSGQPTFTS